MKSLNNNLNRIKLRAAALARLRISGGSLITLTKINGTFSVKAKGLLAAVFRRMLPATGLRVTYPIMGAILLFIDICKQIHNKQGMPGLVKYLKASGVLLQQALSGHRLNDCKTLGPKVSRNQSGFPRFIPAIHRARLASGDLRVGMLWLTLINLFRVLEFKGKVNLATITAARTPCPDSLKSVYEFVTSQATMKGFFEALVALTGTTLRKQLQSDRVKPFAIVKSSPQTVAVEGNISQAASTKPFVLIASAKALMNSGLAHLVEKAIGLFGRGHPILASRLANIFARLCHASVPLSLPSLMPTLTGKLGFKEEPAGKVRVFAMVTAWDQWALRPLHDAMFNILERIPQDGTHNQLGPLGQVVWGKDPLWSLDLTAATDRLPLFLQADLLQTLFQDVIGITADLWSELLTSREYLAFSNKYKLDKLIKYAVGQPMGALSSWSSLAITHHFLVQCAAWHAGVVPFGTWFKGYAIVGDDIVIFNTLVKDSYLQILAALGMPINVTKSILSPKGLGLEFCKRTFIKGQDISPVPVKEFVAANLTLPEAISFKAKYNLNFNQLLLVLGFGFRVRAGIGRHIGQLNVRVRALLFASMLPEILSGDPLQLNERLGALLSQGGPQLSKEQREYLLFTFLLVLKQFVIRQLNKVLGSRSSVKTLVDAEMDQAKSVWSNRALAPYLIQEASGNLPVDPRNPIEWTGQEKIKGTREYFLAEKAGTALHTLNVPPETLMGFRDLMNSLFDPLEELITWIIQEKVGAKLQLAKEIKLALKDFKPTNEDIGTGFKKAIKLLELLVELLDIDPSLDRVDINIPRRVGRDKSEHLWMCFTSIVNEFNKIQRLGPDFQKESGHLARDIANRMDRLNQVKLK